MMMRILRSDRVVKLANRLLRTYSPGLVSGSTVTGMVATGPFLSPGALLTWGRGRFPTGDAGKAQKNTRLVYLISSSVVVLIRMTLWAVHKF